MSISIDVEVYFSTRFNSRHGKEWRYDCICFNHALMLALEFDATIEMVATEGDSEYSYLTNCELCYGKSQLPNNKEKIYKLVREELQD